MDGLMDCYVAYHIHATYWVALSVFFVWTLFRILLCFALVLPRYLNTHMKFFLSHFMSPMVLSQLYEQLPETQRIVQVIYGTRQRIHDIRGVGSQLLADFKLRQGHTLETRE